MSKAVDQTHSKKHDSFISVKQTLIRHSPLLLGKEVVDVRSFIHFTGELCTHVQLRTCFQDFDHKVFTDVYIT